MIKNKLIHLNYNLVKLLPYLNDNKMLLNIYFNKSFTLNQYILYLKYLQEYKSRFCHSKHLCIVELLIPKKIKGNTEIFLMSFIN